MASSTLETAPAPKPREDNCDMVTAVQTVQLTKLETILFEAARQNRADLVKRIIDGKKCNVNVRNSYDRTPMHIAASEGHVPILTLLRQAHGQIDLPDKYGMTPLFWAVYNNHKKAAIYLLEQGAKVKRTTKQQLTIVHLVASSNAAGILKYIYARDRIKLDEKDIHGMTPLLVAASKGNTLLVEVFNRQTGGIMDRDNNGYNALHLAAKNGHMATTQYLLNLPESADLMETLNDEGNTPLQVACLANQQEVVRMLLEAGANPNVSSEASTYPLHQAAHGGFHGVIDTLLHYNAYKDVKNKCGDSALHVAAKANLPETVRFLLCRGFDIRAVNKRLQTALHVAIEQRKTEVVEMLLLTGADLDMQDKTGRVPLALASKTPYSDITDMIIKADRLRNFKPQRAEDIRRSLLNVPPLTPLDVPTPIAATYSTARRGDEYYPDELFPIERNDDNQRQPPDQYESTISCADLRQLERDYLNEPDDDFIDPFQLEFRSDHDSIRSPSLQHQSNTHSSEIFSAVGQPAQNWRSNGNQLIRSAENSRHNRVTFDPRNFEGTDSLDGNSNGSFQPVSGYSPNIEHRRYGNTIMGQTRTTSNGDTVYHVQDINVPLSPDDSAEDYSLLSFNQHYAEELKVLLYELAYNGMKDGSWKSLARHWMFKPEHIQAIESSQSAGVESYKEHGFRTLCIWFHGLEENESPVGLLQQALISTNQNKLARQIRSKLESSTGARGGGKHHTCKVS